MKYPAIIGITGPARCGKDTLANLLKDHGYHRLAFADPLKRALNSLVTYQHGEVMLRLVDLHLDGPEKETPLPKPLDGLGVTPRRLMQTLGTEWGRDTIHPHIWLHLLVATIEKLSLDHVVIPDVRFENEAQLVRSQGVLIHLVRDDVPEVEAHRSESGVKFQKGDWLVTNNKEPEYMIKQMREFLMGCDSRHPLRVALDQVE